MAAVRRCIGLDVHRDFALVAIWQGGVITRAETFATTPEGCASSPRAWARAIRWRWRRPGTRGRSRPCWPYTALITGRSERSANKCLSN
jgi:hypothetical protein